MPTADTSQTTRTKLLVGKTLSTFHMLNPYAPQGGRYPFSQTELVNEIVGMKIGGCCSTTSTPAPGPTPSGTYIVTYLGNTNTGGSAPTDGSSPYNGGTSVTILGNSGSLTKSGVAVFAGWNTEADGNGINYVGGDTFTITQNTTLYARWISAGSRLRYFAGTGGSGTAPSSSGTYYTPFSTADIVGNTGSFTNSNGYIFGGWNTAANGSGTSYPPGSEYIMPSSGNVDLYAQWINPSTTYILTYLAGTGGSGTAPVVPTSYSSNAPATILGNTGSFINSDPTKIFYGWNTAANGTGTSYPVGSTITMNSDKTLYAQWVSATPQYTVIYNGNGSTGGAVPAPPTNYPGGVQVTILGQATLTRPGYSFLGWNSAADGTGSVYQPTSSVIINSDITLYAQWAPGTVIKDCGSFTGEVAIPSIYLSGGRTVYRDTTNNTITILIPTFYSNSAMSYGTGNGPIDNNHSGNLKSSYATATISQVGGVYQINTTYTTAYTGGTYTQTSTLTLGSTYWPTGETISSVTYSNNPAAFQFDPTGTNISVGLGCYGGASYVGVTQTTTQNSVISFYINFSNGTSTRVALGTQFRWSGTSNTYTYVFNYTRAELANGPTPSPITGPFSPTSSTGVNTPNV
jgi:uncharacterized repeat protein (TIGR02543 family)